MDHRFDVFSFLFTRKIYIFKKSYFFNFSLTPHSICTYILFEKEAKQLFIKTLQEQKLLSDSNNNNIDEIVNEQNSINMLSLNQDMEPIEYIKAYLNDKAFKLFVQVLTENNPIKAMALRSIIQRVIMSPAEGSNYQQCFWLWGAPGTSKSTWATIAKTMTQGSVMELSRSRNQFTAGEESLVDAKLLLVSDVNKLTNDMIEILRVVLGRDQLYAERKHTNEYFTIRPYSQVLIISNKSPNDYPNIFTRPELRDKITTIEFKESIPQEFMISNIEEYIIKYSFSFFLWAMFTPRYFLEQQVRGKLLQKYMERCGLFNFTYLHHYIEERLLKPKKMNDSVYVAKSDLRNDFEQWITENSLQEEINDMKQTLKFLPNQLSETLSYDYKIDISQKRIRIKNGRIYAITGITLMVKDYNPDEFETIEKYKGKEFDFGEFDPVNSVEYIRDLHIEDDLFLGKQESIIKYRTTPIDNYSNNVNDSNIDD
uniref:Putative phage-or plasmid-associated DNA primase n=1 Tax=Oedocladium carolinianum TaxID=55992 RepID=A0A1D8GXC0_9CHLO|nr:putative phage- or plasmid-associated DNA primase [Oedocladium carolinianum]YP_009310797.1 putative phage- or plasmid-associated DNA primase [Oedocladium carolinianum]AOT84347.1 putative phage- or plasmid-associated DNA primase [Oedocladium carolinianum]AOT84354.1 putative phage- or plasmid-associated DNA primase [Oedocladium carolinianum]